MKLKKTDWSYYIPELGEEKDDASALYVYTWESIYDAEEAAEKASEDDWDNRDGWEAGVGDGPTIVIVSPDGEETTFETYREAVVQHSVTELQ